MKAALLTLALTLGATSAHAARIVPPQGGSGGAVFSGDLGGSALTNSSTANGGDVLINDGLRVTGLLSNPNGAMSVSGDFRVFGTFAVFDSASNSRFVISPAGNAIYSRWNHVFEGGIFAQNTIVNTGSANGGDVLINDGLRVSGNISPVLDGTGSLGTGARRFDAIRAFRQELYGAGLTTYATAGIDLQGTGGIKNSWTNNGGDVLLDDGLRIGVQATLGACDAVRMVAFTDSDGDSGVCTCGSTAGTWAWTGVPGALNCQ